MPGTDVRELTATLEGLDYTPPCEHSWHETDTRWHAGGATHIVRRVHDCDPKIDVEYYLACSLWAGFLSRPGVGVRCIDCGARMPMYEFAVVVGKL